MPYFTILKIPFCAKGASREVPKKSPLCAKGAPVKPPKKGPLVCKGASRGAPKKRLPCAKGAPAERVRDCLSKTADCRLFKMIV